MTFLCDKHYIRGTIVAMAAKMPEVILAEYGLLVSHTHYTDIWQESMISIAVTISPMCTCDYMISITVTISPMCTCDYKVRHSKYLLAHTCITQRASREVKSYISMAKCTTALNALHVVMLLWDTFACYVNKAAIQAVTFRIGVSLYNSRPPLLLTDSPPFFAYYHCFYAIVR